MKLKSTVFGLLLAFAVFIGYSADAQAVGRTNVPPTLTLQWDASTTTNVVAYKVYYGVASATYTNVVQVPSSQLTCTLTNLVRGTTYFCAVTAYDGTLESDYSNEVSYALKKQPNPPVLKSVTSP